MPVLGQGQGEERPWCRLQGASHSGVSLRGWGALVSGVTVLCCQEEEEGDPGLSVWSLWTLKTGIWLLALESGFQRDQRARSESL